MPPSSESRKGVKQAPRKAVSKPAPRRKRARRPLRWTPILWILLLVNLAVAYRYSPMTTLQTVKVEGARDGDREFFQESLKKLNGIPAFQISLPSVEAQAGAIDAVESFAFQKSVLGSGRLVVKYRTPAARIEGMPNVFLARDGSIFRDERPAFVPETSIVLHAGVKLTVATIAAPFNTERIAWLAENSSVLNLPETRIDVADTGSLSLLSGEAKVVLGVSDDLPQKLTRLKQLIEQNPSLIADAKEINLMDPERPVWVRRSQEER